MTNYDFIFENGKVRPRLSVDTKPHPVPEGSTLKEYDTETTYIFDGKLWVIKK